MWKRFSEKFPDKTQEDLGRHCRNPSGEQSPWCYTGGGQREFCEVDYCGES